MQILLIATLALVGALARPVTADEAGKFDYYVLALSWSPNWCALEGDRRDSDQCDDRHDYGWTMHGLWPQYERGYPDDCPSSKTDPTRRESDQMADIMGSGGLAWYQWKKHGRCSGLDGPDYYALARNAYESVNRPELLRQLDKPVVLPAKVIEDAFLEANPEWSADMLTITCRDDFIQEARLCLTRDLEPRICGSDVRRDCSLRKAQFHPIR